MPAVTKDPASKNGAAPAASKVPQRIIDLQASRAARLEALGEPVVLKWDDGIEFTLPVEMPAEFALCGQEGNMRAAIVALLGDDQAAEMFALRPSMDDINALVEMAGEVYGVTPGESGASARR